MHSNLEVSTGVQESALLALAVLGRAEETMLHAVVGTHLTAPELEELASHPAITWDGPEMVLPVEEAASLLREHAQVDPEAYRTLHERAFEMLAQRLEQGEEGIETRFAIVFERLADRLFTDDWAAFIALVERARDLPLSHPEAALRRSYYQGTALAKQERYEAALEVWEGILAHPAVPARVRARTLNARAICHRWMGRVEAARAGYQASLDLWRQLDEAEQEGKVLLNMGILAYELQQYAEAEARLAEAAARLEVAGAHSWLAVVENELGLVYRDQGRWNEALEHFERFVEQGSLAGASDLVVLGRNNIGELLLLLGRVEEARAISLEALGAMSTRTYRVDALVNLGLTSLAAGDVEDAHRAFQEALELGQAIARREILPALHYRLGDALRRLGRDVEALAHFEKGVETIETMRSPIADEGLKISLVGRWQQLYEALVLQCIAMGRDADAFSWAERARARAFADAIRVTDGAPPEHAARASAVRARLPSGTALLAYFTTGVLDRDIPMLRAIPAESPVRELLLTPPRVVLFVLTPESIRAYTCALDPNHFTSASPRHTSPERWLTPSVLQYLYRALLAPAEKTLQARALRIVPHGPLHHVPFAALTDDDGTPLVRQGGPCLSFVPSASFLLPSESPRQAEGTALAVGYAGEEAQLRHTEIEATLVAEWTGGRALTGSQARGLLREAARDCRWLHFACHGQFNFESPLESYLEVGKGERLHAREVLEEWSLSAELVTLSACQTGVSRVLRGDEPMGLVRAFIYAGARAVLVSRWVVDDLPTFLLMHRFYRGMVAGEGLASALHGAQAWLRTATLEEIEAILAWLPGSASPGGGADPLAPYRARPHPFTHPRYWAAFMLVESGR